MKLNYFVYTVRSKNELEVSQLKNRFFLAVLKLDVKDFWIQQRNWKDGKNLPYNVNIYINIAKHVFYWYRYYLAYTLEKSWKWKIQSYAVVLHG